MRRRLTILTHWLNLVLVILLFAGGLNPVLGWAFVISAAVMCAPTLVLGLMNGPGPKLEGAWRIAHPWLSRGMYLVLAASATITALALLGRWTNQPVTLDEVWFYTIATSGLHG